MDYSMNQKKSKNIGAFVGILVALFVLVGIGLLFYFKLHNPKAQFEVLIEKAFDSLEGNLSQERPNRVSGNFSFQMEGKTDDVGNQQIMDMLNRLHFSFTYGVDYQNKLMRFEMDTQYDEKRLLDVDFYSDAGNGYVYLDGVYDKNIRVALENYEGLFKKNTSIDDYKVIYGAVEKALVHNLKSKYFSMEFVKVDSDRVKKTTLKLNNKNYQELRKNILKELLKEDSFLESLSRVLGTGKVDLKSNIEEMLEVKDEIEEIDFHLYTKNDRLVQFEITSEGTRILIKPESETKYSYEIFNKDQVLYDGLIQLEKNEGGNTILVLYNDKSNGISIQFTIQSMVNENGEISKKDVQNVIGMEEITSEEMQAIYARILQNEGMVALMREFSLLSDSLGGFGNVGSITG